MIELERHIEILLLTNECVIVPDFGGFMTHQVPAYYDNGDCSYIPPKRTLGFNPQLRINDSVLVQSYVEAYDLSYPEALRRIEREVSELKSKLHEDGQYAMEHLGLLKINEDGNCEFCPSEAGVLSPEYYGLSSFTFAPLKGAAVKSTPDKAEPATPSESQQAAVVAIDSQPSLLDFADTPDDESAISIRLSWIRNAVAVAAAVAAFFFMATPIANSNLSNQAMTQLQQNIIYKLIPQDTSEVPAIQSVAATDSDAITPSDATTPSDAIPASRHSDIPPSPAPAKHYCIVVASQVKKSNAESYVEKLHKDGYSEARIYINNDIVRVICGEFESQAEAYKRLNKMNNDMEFLDAWVLKMNS